MIHVNRIGQHLGAEITGVGLSQPLDDATFAQLSGAFSTMKSCFSEIST
jgi:alpha-ketoglutarate-dependent taurine dioxygenase